MRINELLALEIDDLLFDTSEINVNRLSCGKEVIKIWSIKERLFVKNSAKTDSKSRKVSVPISILQDLRDFNNEMNGYFEKHAGYQNLKLIFPTIYGNYMTDQEIRRATYQTFT